MSLQLLTGRAHVPRAGCAVKQDVEQDVEWDVERDAEQREESLCREQHQGGSGLAVPASVPGGMLGSGYGMPSSRELLRGVGDGADSCRQETSGCL